MTSVAVSSSTVTVSSFATGGCGTSATLIVMVAWRVCLSFATVYVVVVPLPT